MPKKIRELTESEKDAIVRKYVTLDQTQSFIAWAMGIHPTSVRLALRERGVKIRKSNAAWRGKM